MFFCIIDLSHYFVFLVKFCFDESKDKIKKSISFVIGYIVGLFLLFLLILCLRIGADAVAKLWADGLFCIIFSAPVACVVFKLLPFLLEALGQV